MTAVAILPLWRVGVYENHHLLCPEHGRQVPDPNDAERAACGCRPVILWHVTSHGEYNDRTDNLSLGRIRYA